MMPRFARSVPQVVTSECTMSGLSRHQTGPHAGGKSTADSREDNVIEESGVITPLVRLEHRLPAPASCAAGQGALAPTPPRRMLPKGALAQAWAAVAAAT